MDPIEWGKQQRRHSALRVLGVGVLVLVAGGLVFYINGYGDDASVEGLITGTGFAAIGALLIAAGVVMLAGRQRTRPPDDIH